MPETPCPGCGYPLPDAANARCPECGTTTDPAALARATADLAHRCMRWSGWMLLAIAAAECVGRSVAYLPISTGGTSGSGQLAAETLALPLKIVLAVCLWITFSLGAKAGFPIRFVRTLLLAWLVTACLHANVFGASTWFVDLNGTPPQWWYKANRAASLIFMPALLMAAQKAWTRPLAEANITGTLSAPRRLIWTSGIVAIALAVLLAAYAIVTTYTTSIKFGSGTPQPGVVGSGTRTVYLFIIDNWLRFPATIALLFQLTGLGTLLLLAAPPRQFAP